MIKKSIQFKKIFSILLAYSLMLIIFLSQESFSVFVFLFAVMTEFAFLLIVYLTSNFLSKEKPKIDFMNIIVGSVAIFFFNYFIIYFAYLRIDQVHVVHLTDVSGWLAPLDIYKYEILIIGLGILLAYIFEFKSISGLEVEKSNLDTKLIKQGLILWILCALTIFILDGIPEKHLTLAITLLPISRLGIELLVFNKVSQEKIET